MIHDTSTSTTFLLLPVAMGDDAEHMELLLLLLSRFGTMEDDGCMAATLYIADIN